MAKYILLVNWTDQGIRNENGLLSGQQAQGLPTHFSAPTPALDGTLFHPLPPAPPPLCVSRSTQAPITIGLGCGMADKSPSIDWLNLDV
jgi:hypothetical protein